MNDQDVRDMLRERAASITPSPDGLERIQAKLDGAVVSATPSWGRRRFPVLASAAAVAVVAVIGTAVVAQRDDTTSVDTGPLATSPTTAVAPAASAPLGVWPWPGDVVEPALLAEPEDAARAYVESRVGHPVENGFVAAAGDDRTVTFNGEVSTTVFLRQHDERWYVESAVSDLVTLHDAGDGTLTARVETGGELTQTMAVSGAPDTSTVTTQVDGGEEYPNLGYRLGRDDVAVRELFVLETTDGTTAITEVAFTAGQRPPAAASTPGVWPWPGDVAPSEDVWLTDPRETALRYAMFRFGGDLGNTTVSDFQQGDANSGEVVFTGDVSTTVMVRQLDGLWHVEAAITDLLELRVEGDEVAWTVPGGGELTGNAEGADVEPDQRGPVRFEPGDGGGIEMTAATGVVRHWFTIVGDDGTTGLAEVRVDHGGASESAVPDDVVFDEGGLDAEAVALAYLADRLDSSDLVTRVDPPTIDADRAEVTWNAGVVLLRQEPDGYWYVTEAIGDSVQIEGTSLDVGTIGGTLRVARAGRLRLSVGETSWDVRNDVDAEDTMVPFEHDVPTDSPVILRVVFESDNGAVTITEKVVG